MFVFFRSESACCLLIAFSSFKNVWTVKMEIIPRLWYWWNSKSLTFSCKCPDNKCYSAEETMIYLILRERDWGTIWIVLTWPLLILQIYYAWGKTFWRGDMLVSSFFTRWSQSTQTQLHINTSTTHTPPKTIHPAFEIREHTTGWTCLRCFSEYSSQTNRRQVEQELHLFSCSFTSNHAYARNAVFSVVVPRD